MKIFLERESLDNRFVIKIKDYLKEIREKIKKKSYDYEESFINLPEDENNLQSLEKLKKYQSIKNLFFIGIGGSHLPLYSLKNFLKEKIEKNIYFLENIDHFEIKKNIENLLTILETRDFLIIVISKSGKTLETLINFYFIFDLVKERLPFNWKEHFIFLTDQNSILDKFALENNIEKFNLPHLISGRFLVFSSISLIFLYLCNLDFLKFIKGAKEVNEIFLRDDGEENFITKTAFWIYRNFLEKRRLYNLIIFSSLLKGLGLWYRQLIAESLGKENKGIIPYYFLVNRDLHSIYQLLVQGYLEHFSNFIYLEDKSDLKIKDNFIFDLDLTDKDLNHINLALYKSIKKNFKDLNFPFFETVIEERNEFEIGKFMEYKMLEIVLLGKLLNINPFNQPSVENYKDNLKKFLEKN